MPAIASLEGMAREMLQSEWAGLGPEQRGEGPPVWMCRDLMQLLLEDPHQAADALAGRVRQLILDQSFVDENGDGVFGGDWHARVEQQVDRLVAVLERLRWEVLAHEGAAPAEVTPLMCG